MRREAMLSENEKLKEQLKMAESEIKSLVSKVAELEQYKFEQQQKLKSKREKKNVTNKFYRKRKKETKTIDIIN